MRGSTIYLIFSILEHSRACDQQEIKMTQDPEIAYIYAIDEVFPGSFNRTLFLEVLNFNDISRGLPIITKIHRNSGYHGGKERCNLPGGMLLAPVSWPALSKTQLSGILYGCQRNDPSKVLKIMINGTKKWNQNDEEFICQGESSIPSKYLDKMKNCYEDLNQYVAKCLGRKTENVFVRSIILIFFSISAFLIAVYFIINFVHFFSRIFQANTRVQFLTPIN